ncbi:hypothetical protein CLU79DRAFT_830304 [Phycomyces nitens]|nr:hypothetical protein CLU79DRAFT_830304 [Phycomyces nitens]
MQSACFGQINNRLFSINYSKQDDTNNPTTTVRSYAIGDIVNPAQSSNTVDLPTTSKNEIYDFPCAFDTVKSEFYVLGINGDKVFQTINVFNAATDGLSLTYSWQILLPNTIKNKIVSIVPFSFKDYTQCVALLDTTGAIYSTCLNYNAEMSSFPYQTTGDSTETTRLAKISNQDGTGFNVIQFGYPSSTIIEFSTSEVYSNATSTITTSQHKLASVLPDPIQAYGITQRSRDLLILSNNTLFYLNVPVTGPSQTTPLSVQPTSLPSIIAPSGMGNITTISDLTTMTTMTTQHKPSPTPSSKDDNSDSENEATTTKRNTAKKTSTTLDENQGDKRKRAVTLARRDIPDSDPNTLVPNQVGLPSSAAGWDKISIFVQPANSVATKKRSLPGVDGNSGNLIIGGYNGDQFFTVSEPLSSLEYPIGPPISNPPSKTGAIVGGVVGGVAFLVILILVFVFCRRKNKRQSVPATRGPVSEVTSVVSYDKMRRHNEERGLYSRIDIPYGMIDRFEPDAPDGAAIVDPYILWNDGFHTGINENRVEAYSTRTCNDVRNSTKDNPRLYTIHYFTTANHSAFVQSIKVARALAGSPHAVKHVAAFDIQTPTNTYGYRYYWLSSICSGNQTLHRMLTHDVRMDSFYQSLVKDFDFKAWSSLSILSALADMHKYRYVHLGLSLETFVYQTSSTITDWEVCCFDQSLEIDQYSTTGIILNSMSAPELFRNSILQENGQYKVRRIAASPAMDLWSLGCIIYHLVAERPLFIDTVEANNTFMKEDSQVNAWVRTALVHIERNTDETIYKAFIPLLEFLLVVGPSERSSARELSEYWRETHRLNENVESDQ